MTSTQTPPAPLGRREQKKLATRRMLRDAALDLALADGVESLTVEAISVAAGVAQRTFFNYFDCKEDALIAETAGAAAGLYDSIVARPAAEAPLHALRMAIAGSDAFSTERTDRDRILARQQLVREHPALMSRQLAQYAGMERTFADAFAERLAAGGDTDQRPELLAAVAVGVLRVATRAWSADGRPSLRQHIDASFDVLERCELSQPQPTDPERTGA